MDISSADIFEGPGGLTFLKLTSEEGAAEVSLHGAHVTHFHPNGASPVLWMSEYSQFAPGLPIRGGIPVCFPWFGPHENNKDLPSHGFARLREWTLVDVSREDGVAEAILQLSSDEATMEMWPHRFTAVVTVKVSRSLEVTLEVANTDSNPFTFTEALHSYFSVSDITSVSVKGLEGVAYYDKVAGTGRAEMQEGAIDFTGETDRPYVGTTGTCRVVDSGQGRAIRVEKRGSDTTVVWNPWIDKSQVMPDFGDDEWQGMVCVETANALENVVTISPGDSHRMTALISVE